MIIQNVNAKIVIFFYIFKIIVLIKNIILLFLKISLNVYLVKI